MGETLIIIQQGDPVIAEEELTFLGIGSAGETGACRRLVYPGTTPLLAPIVYQWGTRGQCLNPSRTLNLDNAVLPHPTTEAVKTIGGTRVLRTEETAADVIVTEIWEPSGGIAMPTFFFRTLYEYLINAPAFSLTQTDFIVWEPRDRSELTYEVELLSLSVGGGSGESRFDVADIRPDNNSGGGDYDNIMRQVNATLTGVIDRTVHLRMRIIAEVES